MTPAPMMRTGQADFTKLEKLMPTRRRLKGRNERPSMTKAPAGMRKAAFARRVFTKPDEPMATPTKTMKKGQILAIPVAGEAARMMKANTEDCIRRKEAKSQNECPGRQMPKRARTIPAIAQEVITADSPGPRMRAVTAMRPAPAQRRTSPAMRMRCWRVAFPGNTCIS